MIKFIKNMFAPRPLPEKMAFVEEEKEYIYMGDGMIEEVIKPKETEFERQKRLIRELHEKSARAEELKLQSNPLNATARANAQYHRAQANPNRTGAAPTATHYDRSYTDNTPISAAVATSVYVHSSPSYSSSDSYSSCDSSSSFSGSCD